MIKKLLLLSSALFFVGCGDTPEEKAANINDYRYKSSVETVLASDKPLKEAVLMERHKQKMNEAEFEIFRHKVRAVLFSKEIENFEDARRCALAAAASFDAEVRGQPDESKATVEDCRNDEDKLSASMALYELCRHFPEKYAEQCAQQGPKQAFFTLVKDDCTRYSETQLEECIIEGPGVLAVRK